MNESLDEIERQLRSWRPNPASPGLRVRVGRRLGRARARWQYAAAAAAVVLLAVGWLSVRTWREVPAPRDAESPDVAATDGGSPPPRTSTAEAVLDDDRPLTLWDYRRAALRSDDDLENLVPPRRGAASQGESEPTIAGRLPSSLFESL